MAKIIKIEGQMDIFDIEDVCRKETKTSAEHNKKKTAAKQTASSKSPKQQEKLTWRQKKEQRIKERQKTEKKETLKKPENLEEYNGNFEEWMMKYGFDRIKLYDCNKANIGFFDKLHFTITNSKIEQVKPGGTSLRFKVTKKRYDEQNIHNTICTCECAAVFVDKNGIVWYMDISAEIQGECNRRYLYEKRIQNMSIRHIKFSKWKTLDKLIGKPINLIAQEESDISKILKKTNPYVFEWAKINDFHPAKALACPYYETLDKAGFVFVQKVIKTDDCTVIEAANRLLQQGRNLKEIFKVSKAVYNTLKKEQDIRVWDSYRKLTVNKNVSADSIQIIYEEGIQQKELERINSILNKKYNGKTVFTWTSLINYLNRLDQFEAISRNEALILLNDYLTMCQLLEMKPKVDGDSLKREHDIAARMARQARSEKMKKDLLYACENQKELGFEFEDDKYLIRSVLNFDDLVDESIQQHNCVASFSRKIIKKTSLIYFMREKAKPDKSLITVELSGDAKVMRQKFLAYNTPIRNAEQTAFLDKWMKFVKEKKKQNNISALTA